MNRKYDRHYACGMQHTWQFPYDEGCQNIFGNHLMGKIAIHLSMHVLYCTIGSSVNMEFSLVISQSKDGDNNFIIATGSSS